MSSNIFEKVEKVRILYCCLYEDKEIAKSEGFHWEPHRKRWYDEFDLRTKDENEITDEFRTRISKNFPIFDIELYDLNDINIPVTKDKIDKYLRLSRFYDNTNERRSSIGLYMEERNRRLKKAALQMANIKVNQEYQFGKRRK